jgi:hypothetical protein
MARRPGQPANNYGDASNENRPSVQTLSVDEIREKLALNPLASKRLRSILDSGATEADPLVYETRAPYGTIPLRKWGCIEVRNVEGVIHVWPLPLAIEVSTREVAGRRNEP